MKKLIAILLSLIMVFSLVACGGGGEEPAGGEEVNNQVENQEEQQQEEIPAASTKTLAYFQKFLSGGEYTMEMKTAAEGMEMTMKSAYKGDMIYSESEYAGQKSIMVMKDGYQYIIDHSSKTVMKMQVVDNGAVMDMFADDAANYETAVASGETEYNGKFLVIVGFAVIFRFARCRCRFIICGFVCEHIHYGSVINNLHFHHCF